MGEVRRIRRNPIQRVLDRGTFGRHRIRSADLPVDIRDDGRPPEGLIPTS